LDRPPDRDSGSKVRSRESVVDIAARHNCSVTPEAAVGTPPVVHRGTLRWSWSVADERRAIAFERYLKPGSGTALAERHFRLRDKNKIAGSTILSEYA
jgi:hypothetical protein